VQKNLFHRFIPVCAAALVVAGCASVGNENLRNESQTSIEQKIVKGKTTKAEVSATLGSPDDTSFTDSGNEIWKYRHVVSTAKASSFIPVISLFAAGSDQEKKEVVVLFDKAGVVTNYTFSATKGEVRQGVFAR
jgi:outer membrane protein assembly factor BamE (lipoprotein component of BamABCDE complex)